MIVTLDNKKISTHKNAADWDNISKAREYVKNLFTQIMGDSVYFDDSGVLVEAYFTATARAHFTGYVTPTKAAVTEEFWNIAERAAYAYSSEHDIHGKSSGKTKANLWDCFVGGIRIVPETSENGETEETTLPVVFHIRHLLEDTRAQVYAIKEEANTYPGNGAENNPQRPPNYAGISASEDKITQNDSFVKNPRSDREDVGYHAGDLGKAEYLAQQGYYRGTGHFGTGTYFVGEEEKVTKF